MRIVLRWWHRFGQGREFPRTWGDGGGEPFEPRELGRALARAGAADGRSRPDPGRPGQQRPAPHTAALLAGLPAETLRAIALRLQQERSGLLARDHEWAAGAVLCATHCGWRPAEVHQLFATALLGVDPVRPGATDWVTAERSLELPLAACAELDPPEREPFQPYLRTLLAARSGCRADLGTPDGRPTAEQAAFAERLRALVSTPFDPDPLLPWGPDLGAGDELFARSARCGLGARLYEEPALRLLELCAQTTELRPGYQWLGRAKELSELTPDLRQPLRILLAAGRGGPADCRPAGQPHPGELGERSAHVLAALAWVAVVTEDTKALHQLSRALEHHGRAALGDLRPAASHFVRSGMAALAALAGEPGAGAHRRLLAGNSPAATRLAREELAAVRDLPAGADPTALRVPVGPYTASFVIGAKGTVELRFRNQAGRLLSGVPSQVRERHPARYAALRTRLAELRTQLVTYRGMLAERLHADPGTPAARWQADHLGDPALAQLGCALVWHIDTPSGPVLGRPVRRKGATHWMLRDLAGRMHELADDTLVRLWSPAADEAEQAAAWRAELARHGLAQPVPQV
ncbi:DUF4132 domain-containing protein [Kitasatospora sp. NBC_01302]|uniref:DUF4132 domain-containing protein n=1 Tax=Kitasatospora sp. NBC_01302 TaxID=2903575 RepID=UPI002E1209EC|nr:DUF4132 domain-containing protein [Kitasatospora sp. NBC_01302]